LPAPGPPRRMSRIVFTSDGSWSSGEVYPGTRLGAERNPERTDVR